MTPQRRSHAAPRGFSLIELVLALAIFALVALIGVEGLSGIIRMRGRLTEIDTATEQMTLTLALLRHDMRATLPAPFYPADGGAAQSALVAPAGGAELALSIGGRAAFPQAPDDPRQGRVIWRLDPGSGRLTRQVWPALQPGAGATPEPAVTMLDGVSALRVRSYTPSGGWVDGDGRGPGLVGFSTTLPTALEVWLETRRFGKLRVLVVLR